MDGQDIRDFKVHLVHPGNRCHSQRGRTMKILIYGAGPLGSVFAARLHQGGHDVSILARGQRLADLREHG
ncbi:MAG: ketopantoate reductase family protein, partial [Anaerolineae bacterium]